VFDIDKLLNVESEEKQEESFAKYDKKYAIFNKFKYFVPFLEAVTLIQDLNQTKTSKYVPYSSEHSYDTANSTFGDNLNAILRHQTLMAMNETTDPDHFTSHLDHMATRAYFLLYRYYRDLLGLGKSSRSDKTWPKLLKYVKKDKFDKAKWIVPEIHIMIAKTPFSLLRETNVSFFFELFNVAIHSILTGDFLGAHLFLDFPIDSFTTQDYKKHVFNDILGVDALTLSIVMMKYLTKDQTLPCVNYFMKNSHP
jgi:hypothetical protein